MSIAALNWAWQLPEVQNGKTMTPSDKLVLVALADHCNEDGQCWPSVRRIVERTWLCERSVRSTLAKLKDEGLLIIDKSEGHSSMYFLPLPGTEHGENSRQHPRAPKRRGAGDAGVREMQGCISRSPTPASNAPITTMVTVKKEEPPLPPESRGEASAQQGPVTKLEDAPAVTKRGRVRNGTAASLHLCDLFYSIYPLKVGEGQVEKAWPKAVKDAGGDPMVIIDGLNARLHLLLLEKERGYCKHPATWLRARAWKDAIPGVEDEDETALPLLTGGKG